MLATRKPTLSLFCTLLGLIALLSACGGDEAPEPVSQAPTPPGEVAFEADTPTPEPTLAPPSPTPAPRLTIALLSEDGSLTEETLAAATQAFAQQRPEAELRYQPSAYDPETIENLLRASDLVLFTSELTERMREHELFFSLLDIEAQDYAPGLLEAGRAMDGIGYWTAPVAIDPVVMVIKLEASRVLGFNADVPEWILLDNLAEVIAAQPERGFARPFVYFVDDGNTTPFDGLAAMLLPQGYGLEAMTELHHPDPVLKPNSRKALADLRAYRGWLAPAEADLPATFPTLADLGELAQQDGYLAFARYSSYAALDPAQQEAIGAGPLPMARCPVSPAYTLQWARTSRSPNPELAQAFHQTLRATAPEWTKTPGWLPLGDALAQQLGYESGAGFIVRTAPRPQDAPPPIRWFTAPAPQPAQPGLKAAFALR